MARPTNEERIEKGVQRSFEALSKRALDSSAKRLTVREMVFARLVAEENETYTDAYKIAFEPSPDAKPESLNELGSRIARRPRVKEEIARIKREIAEDSRRREEKLAIALDGNRVRERMAIELYAMATSDVDERVKLAAWKMLGEMRHVAAFEQITSDANASISKLSGITAGDGAGDAKQKLISSVGGLIAARIAQRVVDVTPVNQDDASE